MPKVSRALFVLTCFLGCAAVSSFPGPASAALLGTACGTPDNPVGKTRMDDDAVNIIACLYTDASHSAAMWKGMTGTIGQSPAITQPSVMNDPSTGLYSPGAGQVAIATRGTTNLVADSGRVGIGTPSPRTPLDVNGEVRLGMSGLACNSSAVGAIRYNAETQNWEGCNDSGAWQPVGGGASCAMSTLQASYVMSQGVKYPMPVYSVFGSVPNIPPQGGNGYANHGALFALAQYGCGNPSIVQCLNGNWYASNAYEEGSCSQKGEGSAK